MRAFAAACAAAIVIAVSGAFILNTFNEPVEQAFSTQGVRI